MAKSEHSVADSSTGGDEITLADVVGFLRRNWKLIAPLTAVFLAAAVAVFLLLPRNYQKDLTLTTDLSPTSELLSKVDMDRISLPTEDQIGAQAVSSLQGQSYGETEIEPRYDVQTKLMTVTARSRDEAGVREVPGEMVDFLKRDLPSRYQDAFDDALQLQVTILEGEEADMRDALERVREAPVDDNSVAEGYARVQLATAEAELENTEQMSENLPRLMADAFDVRITDESGLVQPRVPAALLLLAVVGSLAVATALALLREVLARRQ